MTNLFFKFLLVEYPLWLGDWRCSLMSFTQNQFFAQYEAEDTLELGHLYLRKHFGYLWWIGKHWELLSVSEGKGSYNITNIWFSIRSRKIKRTWTGIWRWKWSKTEHEIVEFTLVSSKKEQIHTIRVMSSQRRLQETLRTVGRVPFEKNSKRRKEIRRIGNC